MKPDLWEEEYKNKGIPSSFRDTPTRIVKLFAEKYKERGNALDIGCGRGRNSIFLAQNGYRVHSVDFVESVLRELDEKAENEKLNIKTFCQSVTEPLPFADHSFDLVIDIFCYKHQIDAKLRASYRKEMLRVLRPSGFLVLSLAGKNDGFYGPLLKPGSNVIIDPYTEIASVLFDKEDIENEFSDFDITEYMPTSDESPMHGKTYKRETLNFIMKKI